MTTQPTDVAPESPASPDACESCDGRGYIAPVDPCSGFHPPAGFVIVERCDDCERFPDDLGAAQAFGAEARWMAHPQSGRAHAVARPVTPALVVVVVEGGVVQRVLASHEHVAVRVLDHDEPPPADADELHGAMQDMFEVA